MFVFHDYNIFRPLKLKIATAIPASNEWDKEVNTSAGWG